MLFAGLEVLVSDANKEFGGIHSIWLDGCSDFLKSVNDEARAVAPDMRQSADPAKARAEALDELITKKVLLQEAQAHNFDNDKKFMKEIELYWEQALLKLLLRSKIDELSKKVGPGISGSAKQDMLQAELTKWIAGLRSAARVKIYKENLDKVDIK